MSPRERHIVLSADAENDLADILQYTLETWGPRQMKFYAVKLDAGLSAIAGQPKIGTTRDDLFPGCRSQPIEEHVVFYDADDREIRVARVLHKRMNVRLYL